MKVRVCRVLTEEGRRKGRKWLGNASVSGTGTRPRNYDCLVQGLLVCSVRFSASLPANPAIDYAREEIEWCMINRDGWQPRDACFSSPFPAAFSSRFPWPREEGWSATAVPIETPWTPWNALWRHRGKKPPLFYSPGQPKNFANQNLPKFSPPFCSAHLVIPIQPASLLWDPALWLGYADFLPFIPIFQIV